MQFSICFIWNVYNNYQSCLTAKYWLLSSNPLKRNFLIMNYICWYRQTWVSMYCYKNIQPRGTFRSHSVCLPQSGINCINAIFDRSLTNLIAYYRNYLKSDCRWSSKLTHYFFPYLAQAWRRYYSLSFQ